MKLLFDQNVSPELITRLDDLFPDSDHVFSLNLHEQDDSVVWSHARRNDFIVVSKDADFAELSVLRGFPPKLLWLRLGNCTTNEIAEVIRESYDAISEFVRDSEHGILSLSRRKAG